ncbi:MAG: hypothetical protein HPY72_13450 [Anaerolineae bacterium]|nr:hypothetical protein [Anaerolineae bacterium]
MRKNKIIKAEKINPRSWLYWLVIPLTFIVWSLWPQPQATWELRMDESLLDQPATQSCPLLNRLSRYDFIVKLPQRIWNTEQTNLLLTLQAPRDLLFLSVNEMNACSLALETNLVVSNLAIQPGETLIEPFVGNESQIFLYAVSLRGTGIARGEMWIVAKYKPAGALNALRLPLFSVPVEITPVSILGLPPALVRYIAILVMLILLAVFFHRRLREGR